MSTVRQYGFVIPFTWKILQTRFFFGMQIVLYPIPRRRLIRRFAETCSTGFPETCSTGFAEACSTESFIAWVKSSINIEMSSIRAEVSVAVTPIVIGLSDGSVELPSLVVGEVDGVLTGAATTAEMIEHNQVVKTKAYERSIFENIVEIVDVEESGDS